MQLRRELVEGNRDAYLPNLATSVNNLATYLAEAGRRVQALTTAHEAVELYQELAGSNPHVFEPAVEQARNLVAALSEDT